jgi:hypothetical protein
VSNEEESLDENLGSVMKKNYLNLILNTIPSFILIRLCSTSHYCFSLKGDKFTDPIDGKSFKSMLPYGYETQRNNVLAKYTFFRDIVYCGCTSTNKLIFYSAKKVLHFAPEQAFLYYQAKKLDYTTTDLFSHLRM